MKVSVASRSPEEIPVDLLALPVPQQEERRWKLPPAVAAVDRALGGTLGAALSSGDFRGRAGESHLVYAGDEIGARRVLLLGLGAADALDREALRRVAGEAVRAAGMRRGRKVALWVPPLRGLGTAEAGQAAAEGAVLATYRFAKHKGEQSEDPGKPPEACSLIFDDAAARRPARDGARVGVIVAESQNVARDLSNEPGGDLPPAALAREAGRVARQTGLRFRALGVPELRKEKMGGILAVGGGSARPPRLIVLEHGRKARGRKRPTVCLVGKGVTFDSGGISIKPSASMDEMKHDMAGAAAVVGALRAAALLDLPLHVVGLIPAAENLPSATAYRPGDVVRTRSGRTVEVLNTDAEGRVVLSDALHYARTEFAPDAIVDLATLTGACVVALGPWASGLMGNDEALVERVRAAGETAGERAWPLPLWEEHREHIRSEVADIKNAGGREGGTLTAAAFLSHFVEKTPWAHLDIAATAWTKKAGPCQPVGATGVGVRLLVELLRGWRGGR